MELYLAVSSSLSRYGRSRMQYSESANSVVSLCASSLVKVDYHGCLPLFHCLGSTKLNSLALTWPTNLQKLLVDYNCVVMCYT